MSNVRGEVQQLATTWSNQMEEQGAACLPRVVRSLKEIEVLRGESESLSELIDHLHGRVGTLEVETSASVRTLSELEVIKRRMDSCSSVLLQADRFKVLLQSMDEVYESGDVPRMSAALSSLVSSFSNLSNLAEFEGDKALIARYTERLESLVRPKMLKAFETHDTAQALACIATFRQIDRAEQIALVYHKLFNQKVLTLWQTFDPPQAAPPPTDLQAGKTLSRPSTPSIVPPQASNLPPSNQTPSKPIDSWITTFYTQLSTLFQQEVAWTPTIFPDAPTAIAKLFISALTQQGTLIDAHLRKLDILRLTAVYSATKAFASSIDFLVVPLGPGLRLQVFQSLFAPFRKFQSQYVVLESQYIDNGLGASGNIPSSNDSKALLQALTNYAKSLFAMLHTATDHCIRFTEAAEAEALHKLVTARISSLIQIANQTLQNLRTTLLGPKSTSFNTFNYETSEWNENIFNQAIDATKFAAHLVNLFRRFSQHFRTQVLSQKSALFGEDALEAVIQLQEPVTSNLFLYQSVEGMKSLAKLMLLLTDPAADPFESSAKIISEFTSATQLLVFETMFGFIRHQMSSIPKQANFAREASNASPAAQSYIKHVVEHFLVLPQVMEAMEHEGEENTVEEVTYLNLPVQPFEFVGRPKYLGFAASVASSAEGIEDEESNSGFSGDWMDIVARETQLLLSSQVLQIPHLTSFGVQQLDTDVQHLFSVLSVLGLHQEPLLEQILEYCHVPNTDFTTLLSETNDLERKKMLILLGRARRVLPAK